ncbi:MAG: thioredoxin domain-containing protein [Deltaproteobacteria bacterium]|nr:thioredoxin domain-containing protein [Deltaproteobacteria bacterium]
MSSARVRVFAVLSVVGLLGITGMGASCNRNNSSGASTVSTDPTNTHTPPTTPARPASETGGDRVTELSGFDTAALSAAERDLLWNVSNDLLSPCGDPHSLAVCARDRLCGQCRPALRFLSRRVQDGFDAERLGDLVRSRFARDGVVQINVDGSAARGPATAPVTLVEFSDYECPHCAAVAPVLRDIEREFGERLRVIHMHFPLTGHTHAMGASRAAVAAGRQGKFWEFHDLLFANQSALERNNLEQYAQRLQLDMTRFRADVESSESEARVASDRREGERLQIDGTPTMFINGRRWPSALQFDRAQLREWITDELELAGGQPAQPAR